MTTTKNILFMSGSYVEQFGEEFSRTSEITPEKVLQADLKIHAEKLSNELRRRRKSNAEVFTPAWLVNQMVNACDESWFGRKNVFNVELGKGWRENSGDIDFAGRNWQEYVKLTFLEITCGEAPFIASRYDAPTGAKLENNKCVGILDRKLRVVAQQCRDMGTSEKLEWALKALKSCYGYELQGDNLLIARVNVLLTFWEFCRDKLGIEPDDGLVHEVCDIICWNFWQMDGLNKVVPMSQTRCMIMDWRKAETMYFDECGDQKPDAPKKRRSRNLSRCKPA